MKNRESQKKLRDDCVVTNLLKIMFNGIASEIILKNRASV